MAPSDIPPTQPARLGAFLGVFTPTVLTILGVIMYLRTGWVVGNAGLVGTLAIVVIANTITALTALSMSALATSMRVGAGGAYFLISRSFGLAVGGAIGIPLYMAQALSVTLYAYGLAEVAQMMWPGAPVPVVAAAVVVAVGALASRSTSLALKAQLPIMALIFVSIAALFLGTPWSGPQQVPAFAPPDAAGFWTVFAVFFPAVTGILAGVSLSGDLADPGKAIPRGTLAAVVVGFLVYLAVPVSLALSRDPSALVADNQVWNSIATLPGLPIPGAVLVIPGMLGAILSSAVGSILGAPRTLQALATDGLVSKRFARTDPATGEPTTALRLTIAIAFFAVFLGDLNLVASVLTMFFLTTYGMLNFVAGTEDLVRDPSFRPRIRVPWALSFVGAAGCVVAMLSISATAAVVAILLEGLVYFSLRRHALTATWGDVSSGVWYSTARWSLEALNRSRPDPRSWRPHILLFAVDLSRVLHLAKFACDFGQQRGIVTVATLRVGDLEDLTTSDELLDRNRSLLATKGIRAFPEVVSVPDLTSGVITVAQANGYAGLSSNTCMFGWPEDVGGLATLLGISRRLDSLAKSTVIAKLTDTGHPTSATKRPSAVLWWKGMESNGDLMLLLAFLLSQSAHWRGLRIILRSIVDDAPAAAARRAELQALVPDLRIDVEIDVLASPPEHALDLIRERSRDASIVFLGLGMAPKGAEQAYATMLMGLAAALPNVVLVRNAGPFRGRLMAASVP